MPGAVSGFSASGNATIKGNGVTIYIAGGSINFGGNSNVLLSASTNGAFNGVSIFQTRSDTSAINLSGNAYLSSGTLYAPNAVLNLSGNSNLSAPLIVGQLALSGNAAPSPTPPNRLGVGQTSVPLDLLAFIRGIAQGSAPSNFANASTGTRESPPNSVQGAVDQMMATLSTGASSNFGEELPELLTQAHDGNLIIAAIEDVLGGLDVSDLSNYTHAFRRKCDQIRTAFATACLADRTYSVPNCALRKGAQQKGLAAISRKSFLL